MHAKRAIAAVAVTVLILGAWRPPGDACALLTQAEISSVLGTSFEAGQRVVPSNTDLCKWSEPGDPMKTTKRVLVSIRTPDQYTTGKTPLPGVTKTPVSGIGDDAFYTTAGALGTTLSVEKGTKAFNISIHGQGFSVDQIKAMEKTLAQDVLARL